MCTIRKSFSTALGKLLKQDLMQDRGRRRIRDTGWAWYRWCVAGGGDYAVEERLRGVVQLTRPMTAAARVTGQKRRHLAAGTRTDLTLSQLRRGSLAWSWTRGICNEQTGVRCRSQKRRPRIGAHHRWFRGETQWGQGIGQGRDTIVSFKSRCAARTTSRMSE